MFPRAFFPSAYFTPSYWPETLACADIVYDPLGRTSISVDQPPGAGDNYPFMGASDLNDLIADAYISYRDDRCELVRPFRIRWLYGFGCVANESEILSTNDFDVLIEDANGTAIFDTRDADDFREQAWGDRLLVLQWELTDSDLVLRLVVHTAWPPDAMAAFWPRYIEPENGVLDDRVAECRLPHVRSLRVDLGDKAVGSVRFKNGYNTMLSTAATSTVNGGRLVTTVTLDAQPGTGRGKFGPPCNEEDDDQLSIRRINGSKGDTTGNLVLDASGGKFGDAANCYRIERPIAEVLQSLPHRQVSVLNHTLQFFNDCGPCCECQDFINTYEGIRRLRDRYAELYERAQAVRDLYAQNVTRFEDQADCRLRDPLRLVARPVCPDEIAIAIGYCHRGSECLYNLVIPFSFQFTAGDSEYDSCNANTSYSGDGDPDIVCNTAYRGGNISIEDPPQGYNRPRMDAYRIGGKYPNFYAIWDRVDPGTMAEITFHVRFPNSLLGDYADLMLDAYAVPELGSPFPITGYTPGVGPVTEEAREARLVETCRVGRIYLQQEECCEADESVSEL